MSELAFTTRGVAELLAAQEKLSESLGKQKTAAKKLSDEYRANESDLKRLQRVADQIYRNNETAQERYNRKLAEAKVALEGNVDATELLRREQERLKKELDETGTSGKSAGDSLASAFDPKKLLGYAAGFVSIKTIVSAITAELRAQQEMIDKRNAAQLGVGESRNVLLRNLVGLSDAKVNQTLEASRRISNTTGVSEVSVNNALASAVSATGGNVQLSEQLVELATKYLKDRPDEIGDFSGSLGDMMRVTGSADPKVALGLLIKTGQLSRITSPAVMSRAAAPALINTLTFGGDGRTAAALYAALTTGAGDTKGEFTGTAEISLAQQLKEFDFGLKDRESGTSSAKSKAKQAADHVASVRRQIAEFEQDVDDSTRKEQARLARKKASAELRLTYAQDDAKAAKTPHAKQMAARRLAAAQQGLNEVNAEISDSEPNRRRERLNRDLNESIAAQRTANTELATRTQEDARLTRLRDQFGGVDMLARIQYLQANPALARQFLANASFEKKSVGVITQLLLDPNSQVAQEFKSNLAQMPSNAALAKLSDQALAMPGKFNQLEPVAERKRWITNKLEELQVKHTGEYLSTEELQSLHDIALESGGSNAGAALDEFVMRARGRGKVRTEDVIGSLENRVYSLKHPTTTIPGVSEGDMGETIQRTPTRAEETSAKLLQEIVNQLKDSNDKLRRINNKDGMIAGGE